MLPLLFVVIYEGPGLVWFRNTTKEASKRNSLSLALSFCRQSPEFLLSSLHSCLIVIRTRYISKYTPAMNLIVKG